MDGWWECEDLDEFFYRISKHRLYDYIPSRWSDIFRLAMARLFNLQSKIRARKVCDVHYNLGNDLFAQMLDPHMQYSCGYWDGATTLEEAQRNKLRMICEKLQLEPAAEYAARHYDVTVVGVSNSSEQVALARGRCTGLNVEILLSDYRDLDPDQRFDRVVSVGMIEHVGPKNYDLFFSIVDRCLAPQGIFLLHTIGSNTTVAKLDDWTEKYIFPNGCLPSIQQIGGASEKYFVMEDWHNFGADYDVILMAWHARFLAAWPKSAHAYDERFKRMFEYYLKSCAGSFRARDIQLWQVVFTRGIEGGLRVPRGSS
ncbi:cyclopropane-fatty-acyl-phospholipid synthase-like [Bemisia tabaci]|uniref:cyclopropane-fatty-acyl-phospholipid synthase-like n=1 Tax=Bemisia tabaci TaxID=7038 RepID=UPI003B28B48D